MILNDDKIIFIHIPHNGGTTIGNIVHPKSKINNTDYTYSDILDSGGHHAEHKTYDEYQNIITDSINNYFVFTFIRNPYSRLFSKWRQGCIEYQQIDSYKHWGYRGYTQLNNCFFDNQSKILFKKFVNCLYEDRTIINNIGGSQLHFMGNNIKNMNYIGRFENFQSDIKTLINLLNRWVNKSKFEFATLHLNQKSKYINEYKDYYDGKTQKQIQQILFTEFFQLNYDYNFL